MKMSRKKTAQRQENLVILPLRPFGLFRYPLHLRRKICKKWTIKNIQSSDEKVSHRNCRAHFFFTKPIEEKGLKTFKFGNLLLFLKNSKRNKQIIGGTIAVTY